MLGIPERHVGNAGAMSLRRSRDDVGNTGATSLQRLREDVGNAGATSLRRSRATIARASPQHVARSPGRCRQSSERRRSGDRAPVAWASLRYVGNAPLGHHTCVLRELRGARRPGTASYLASLVTGRRAHVKL